jgi:cytochrome c
MKKQVCTWILGASAALLIFATPAQATDLTDFAKSGDLAGVASALDNGAAVDEPDGGVTALYIAVEAGNVELAKLLIDRGADVNLPVKFKRTPLYAATFGSFPDLVKLLLDSGADPSQLAKSQTPLHVAADVGCLQCAIYLVEAGADVNALTANQVPPIHFAVRNGHNDVVAYLHDHGAAPPAVAPISTHLASANIDSGKEIFANSCATCHLTAAGEFNEVRPNLWGVLGRPKGSESGVRYTPVFKELGGTWTFEDINALIAHPMATVPGTEMSFEGLADEQQRADVIAYLRTLSDNPVPLPAN